MWQHPGTGGKVCFSDPALLAVTNRRVCYAQPGTGTGWCKPHPFHTFLRLVCLYQCVYRGHVQMNVEQEDIPVQAAFTVCYAEHCYNYITLWDSELERNVIKYYLICCNAGNRSCHYPTLWKWVIYLISLPGLQWFMRTFKIAVLYKKLPIQCQLCCLVFIYSCVYAALPSRSLGHGFAL